MKKSQCEKKAGELTGIMTDYKCPNCENIFLYAAEDQNQVGCHNCGNIYERDKLEKVFIP